MSDLVERFQKLQKQRDKARREIDRSVGAQQQLQSRLKKEFGFDTVKEAEERIEELEAKKAKLEKQFVKKEEEFQKQYKGVLGE